MDGLKILDVELNNINGGSFAVTAGHAQSKKNVENKEKILSILSDEEKLDLKKSKSYIEFSKSIYRHRDELIALVNRINASGKTVFGYGASTKGNVLLQFCGFTHNDISFIAEVNSDKYGCYTPGSGIPIISEKDAKEKNPDYFLVLPWHFKTGIIEKEKKYLEHGGKLIFPLPFIDIV